MVAACHAASAPLAKNSSPPSYEYDDLSVALSLPPSLSIQSEIIDLTDREADEGEATHRDPATRRKSYSL